MKNKRKQMPKPKSKSKPMKFHKSLWFGSKYELDIDNELDIELLNC